MLSSLERKKKSIFLARCICILIEQSANIVLGKGIDHFVVFLPPVFIPGI